MQADLKIDNVFSELPIASGVFVLKSPDVSAFNILLANKLYPEKVRRILNDFELKKGAIDLKCRIFDNKAYADVDLSGISFEYIPLELPVDIVNGKLSLRNDLLKLNKINVLADRMPVLFDGEIKNIFDKQNFNIYLSSKPMQEFIDKYINKNQIYPIKIKGDIVYWARFKGVPDNYDVKAQFDMSKDSSIYHFGATVGDVENAIVIALESKIIDGTKHRIKEFLYDKVIDSQSGRKTRLNMLKAWGDVEILSEDLLFDDLHIKTSNPTDARIFNIIFRKPNIKQGQFVSDLKFKGHLSNPKVLGKFHITETNIPFFDTVMKNIEFEFNDKTVELVSKGEVMGNDVAFEGVMKNKLTQPYHFERGYFYTKDLDLNRIVNNLKIAEIESISNFESLEAFSLKSLIFNDLKIKADNIRLRNLNATNFDAQSSLNSAGLINVQKFKFNVADGNLDGNYQYNINTEDMRINFLADGINANDLATALFDLDNQIYGDLTGKVDLTCNGEDFNKCMQTLSGVTMFNVKDGRMPKLGSLEYLLKAGNLVKGGITGLSINSVIDLISPLKTGEFSNIFGSVNIKDGLARNIEITTQGEDLSLFIGGTYNFANSNADMQVLGLLARKISNILGPIGNISINTLFNVIPGVDLAKDSVVLEKINKIPGIELSSKAYRKFIADIKGNINGDDYVTSFKWIN